jgi:transposase
VQRAHADDPALGEGSLGRRDQDLKRRVNELLEVRSCDARRAPSGVTDHERLGELSKGKTRAKSPQLREALQSRFTIEHHGVMVAQLLSHIDTLDTELQHLTERVELVLASRADINELLSTIPGVPAQAAQVLIAERGIDMTTFPTVGQFS